MKKQCPNQEACCLCFQELETAQPLVPGTPGSAAAVAKELGVKMKTVNERATLLNITCNAMINASADFLDQAATQGKRSVGHVDTCLGTTPG